MSETCTAAPPLPPPPASAQPKLKRQRPDLDARAEQPKRAGTVRAVVARRHVVVVTRPAVAIVVVIVAPSRSASRRVSDPTLTKGQSDPNEQSPFRPAVPLGINTRPNDATSLHPRVWRWMRTRVTKRRTDDRPLPSPPPPRQPGGARAKR